VPLPPSLPPRPCSTARRAGRGGGRPPEGGSAGYRGSGSRSTYSITYSTATSSRSAPRIGPAQGMMEWGLLHRA